MEMGLNAIVCCGRTWRGGSRRYLYCVSDRRNIWSRVLKTVCTSLKVVGNWSNAVGVLTC
jgi:hypothetical protein